MPVDLSRIGLEGQESFANRQMTMAQAANLEASAVETDLANRQNARLEELSQIAADKLRRTVNREPNEADPEALAERMSSLADPLEMVADVYMQGGAVETGMDLLKSASEIRKREADMENDEVVQQQNRLENILKGAEIIGQRFGTAMNQDEWNLAIEETQRDLENGIFSMEPEMFEQIKNMEFDPDVAAFFRDRAISVTDQARMDLQRVTQDRLERIANNNSQEAAARLRISEARLEETRRHNEVMERVSGNKDPNTPTTAQLSNVKSVLESGPFRDMKVKGDPDFESAAQYVAGLALETLRQNPAMTWDTAVRQSVMRGEQAGVFGREEGGRPLSKGFRKQPDTPSFDGKGLKPETAIPLPKEKSKLVKGRYYITARGRAKWDGSSFVSVK